MNKGKSQLANILLLILVGFMWGCAYILTKKSLNHLTPFQLAMSRMLIAGLLYLPLAIPFIKKVRLRDLKYFFVVGIIGAAIPAILFSLAQQHISSSLSGALGALTPLSTLLLGILFFGVKSSLLRISGLLVGLLGALIIVFGKSGPGTITSPVYAALILLATIMYAWSTNVIGKYLKHFPGMGISSIAFGMALVLILPFFAASGVGQQLYSGELHWAALKPVFLIALLSTVFGLLGYVYLIKRTGPVFASTVNYLAPVVALFFGILDGEKIFLIHLVGMGCLLLGIFLTKADP